MNEYAEVIRVMLVDDHRMYREALRNWLVDRSGIVVVAEAQNGKEAVELAIKLTPDIVVMDVDMPVLDGIQATREILGSCPDTRVVALSLHDDRRLVDAMLEAGASGYLLKNDSWSEILANLTTAASGAAVMSSGLTKDADRGRPPDSLSLT